MENLEKVDAVTTEEFTEKKNSMTNEQGIEKSNDKKYSDEDLNRIIAKKIAAERKRMSKIFNEEQQESEYDERLKNLEMREKRMDAIDKLNASNYPRELADLMNYSTKEDYETSFEKVVSLFDNALDKALKSYFKDKAPIRSESKIKAINDYKEAFKHPSSR